MVYTQAANTGASRIEYNLQDQPTVITNNHNQQTIAYDNQARPTKVQYCDIAQASHCDAITYQYNNKNQLQSIQDNQQTTSYVYTEQGQLAKEDIKFNQSPKAWQTTYQYDNKDRLEKVSLPEGAVLTYQYNEISQPVNILYQAPTTHWWQDILKHIRPSQQPLLSQIKVDSGRGLQSFTHNNGETTQAKYDQAGRLQAWQDGKYSSDLTYNQTNQLVGIKAPQQSQQLDYDNQNRLTKVALTRGSNRYQYDTNGNRLLAEQQLATNPTKSLYRYQANTDKLLAVEQANANANTKQQTQYQYDAVGNPVQISTTGASATNRELTYTPRGQIATIKDNGQPVASYEYNYAMQRVSKHHDNQTERYLWQGGLIDAEISDNQGQERLTRRYIYLGLRPVAVIDYDADDQAHVYSIHTDYLGTPKQVTDENKTVVWQAEHDDFGKVLQVKSQALPSSNTSTRGWSFGWMNSANASEIQANNAKGFVFNLRFAGQYEDGESGYYYNWHRFYDPSTGRYLTSDPIGLAGGLNSYSYVGQNPFGGIDPWGLYTIFIGGAGDKEDFWYIFPKHYVVRDYSSKFRDDLSSYFQEKLHVNNQRANQLATYNVKYYGYNEIDQAYNLAVNFLNAFPTAKINIVGHSLGGWQAAQLADKLNSKFNNRCVLSNLITLDPVGTVYSWNPLGSIKFKTPKTNAPVWTNVKADYTGFPSRNNIVAILGGQWNPSSSGLSPTYNYKFVADHLDVDTLMSHKIMVNDIQQNFSPYDLLLKYYQNNLNLINTFQ